MHNYTSTYELGDYKKLLKEMEAEDAADKG